MRKQNLQDENACALLTYQYSSLSHRVLDLISPNYLCFLQNFQSIQLSIILLLDEDDLSIGALSNDGNHFKVFLRNIAASSLLLIAHTFLVLCIDHLFLFGLLLRCQSEVREKFSVR